MKCRLFKTHLITLFDGDTLIESIKQVRYTEAYDREVNLLYQEFNNLLVNKRNNKYDHI